MGSKTLICLGKFSEHSFNPWVLREDIGCYFRECNLAGCSHSETAPVLRPAGQTAITGGKDEPSHEWSAWQSAADQFGLVTPPWRYKRICSACGAAQLAENLETI